MPAFGLSILSNFKFLCLLRSNAFCLSKEGEGFFVTLMRSVILRGSTIISPSDRKIKVTELQKERTAGMRSTGTGYSQIAKALSLSVNSVKSYCQRNGLGIDRKDESYVTEDQNHCKQCGSNLNQIGGRKARRFCSDACRIIWWNRNRNIRKSCITFSCVNCRKPFLGNNRQSRKYCSHACYIAARYGKGRG